jgi:LPS sulfotransferase NodH
MKDDNDDGAPKGPAGNAIIMCATQRTGSTMVFDDLLNVMGCEPRNAEWLYERIVREKTTDPWQAVWAEVRERNHVAGFTVNKVMFHYTPQISAFIAGNPVVKVQRFLEFKPGLFDAFHAFFRDAIWVYVERRDVFAQAVSMYLAEATALWEIRAGPSPPRRLDVRYDRVKLRNHLKSFLAERTQWPLLFEHYGIKPLRIEYEDAATRYPAYLDELLARAGFCVREPVPARRLFKVGTDLNHRFAEALRTDVLTELYQNSLGAG